jgi:hypothetical protein
MDDTAAEGPETFVVNLANPVGTTGADGPGVAPITDGEPPRLPVAAVAVNGGAAQRSRVNDIPVTFTGLATRPADPAAAIRLTRLGPGAPAGNVTLGVDLSASTTTQTVARLTFSGRRTESGSLLDGNDRLTILSSQVTAGGQPRDGDGDGTPGGDYRLSLYRLYGDASGDRRVDNADFFLFRSTFDHSSPDPLFLDFLDANGDGRVDNADFFQFRARFGTTLP